MYETKQNETGSNTLNIDSNYIEVTWQCMWQQSQWCGCNLHGPFVRAALLTTVEVNTQAMEA